MSYHCQSSHYISAFLSNFSLNLSASLSILHFSLASLLNDPFDHFHFLCPDALLWLSDLPKCSSFAFHTFIKHIFLSDISLAVVFLILATNYSISSLIIRLHHLPLWHWRQFLLTALICTLWLHPAVFFFFISWDGTDGHFFNMSVHLRFSK